MKPARRKRLATDRLWTLYCMIAEDNKRSAFMKIGICSRIEKRVGSVQGGCPLKIGTVLVVPAGFYRIALVVEREMHKALAAFRSSGEWFRFDLKDPAHKAAFKAAGEQVLGPHLGPGWKWHVVDLKALRRAVKTSGWDGC